MDTSKYKALYLQETGDHISGIEKGLLALEKDQGEARVIDDLFRHYHSIKGMSASMGYTPLMRLAHAQEDLLDRARSGRLRISPEIISTLFQCLDGLKGLVDMVSKDLPLETEIEPFLYMLKASMEGRPAEEAKRPAPKPAAEEEGALRLSNVMKVEGRVFDDLLAIVGDLFMALSTFRALTHSSRSVALKDGVHLLGKTVNSLHGSILTARMLPIKDLTEGLPRVVRDMTQTTGKEVALAIEGAELKLDRAILEGLGSPLVHIIRNAVDHGIEGPSERAASGKDPRGSIAVRAYGKKDRVVIEVIDDGRGMDVEALKRKAVSRGLSPERIRALTDKEALLLVCLPGLSTAEKVTDTSGRGVGMDVVKSAIEALGGALDIESAPGRGTKIIMELPRTTSIIKALAVNVDFEQFLIPISRIEKVVEVGKEAIAGGVLVLGGTEVPVIPLGRMLGMDEVRERDTCAVIVVKGQRRKGAGGAGLMGIKVDGFGEEIDAYIRPLLPPISRLWGVSGITVLGDGRPVFLLDIAQITSKASVQGSMDR